MYNLRNKLIPLLESGIYGILNNRNKSIYIGASINMLKAVSLQLDMIQNQVHPSIPHTTKPSNLQVLIIETTPSDSLKLRQTYWVDKYLADGYKVYNTHRLLRLRTRIRVDREFNILVELVSRNNKSRVVGTFKRMQDAETYCKHLQSSNFQVFVPKKENGIK